MNLPILAAEIARRIPDMAWDSPTNNSEVIQNLIREEMQRGNPKLAAISERLRTQDNRITENPMFCVQEKKLDVGYDSNYSDNPCWYRNAGGDPEIVFDKKPEGEGWEQFGYVARWQTVMVAFTEVGCQQYINLNGHNHHGELRIYAESFRRCPEMIAIREALISGKFI